MTTIVTGIEHSGTGVMASIVRTGIPDALHRAMPHVDSEGQEIWWNSATYHNARYIIILRDRLYRNLTTVAHGWTPEMAEARSERALRILADLRPALWISLEALIENPEVQVDMVSDWLGVKLSIPVEIYDCNAPWRQLVATE